MKFHNFEPLTERIVQCHTNVSFLLSFMFLSTINLYFLLFYFLRIKNLMVEERKKGNKGDQYKGEQLQL